MTLTPTQGKLNPPSSPSFCGGRKRDEVNKARVWNLLHDDPQCPSRLLLDKVAQTHTRLDISVRHVNRLRRQWQRNRPKGRPRHTPSVRPVAVRAPVVHMRPHPLALLGRLTP